MSASEDDLPTFAGVTRPDTNAADDVTRLGSQDEMPTVAGSPVATTPGREALAAAGAPGRPAVIGRYRILRLIGEGGMGAVYEAEQDHPRRTVALKVIKAGLATPEILRRFAQEAQALGRLQHLGIAYWMAHQMAH